MVLDGARADEQPGTDLRVGQAVTGQPCHLGLLSGQRVISPAHSLADCLARGEQLAPGSFGECPGAHRLQHLVGGAQLLARIGPPVLTAQPLAVDQVRAGQLGADAGPAKVLDRRAVVPLGRLALAEQAASPRLDPQHPVGRGHPGTFGQPFQDGREELHIAGPGCRLGQLGHDMGSVPHRFAFECTPRRVVCGSGLPEAVVQDRARIVCPADQGGRGVCSRLPGDGLDQLRRLPFLAPPGREHHHGVRDGRISCRLRDQVIFFDEPRRRGQLSGENVRSGQVIERERQVHERAGVTGELDLASGQGAPGLEIP